jgi:hypothetical protein
MERKSLFFYWWCCCALLLEERQVFVQAKQKYNYGEVVGIAMVLKNLSTVSVLISMFNAEKHEKFIVITIVSLTSVVMREI